MVGKEGEMVEKKLKYYVETMRYGSQGFSLWAKKDGRYYDVATLFWNDQMCGTQWTVNEVGKSVSYGAREIRDEVEMPLVRIWFARGEELVAMEGKPPQEVFEKFKLILSEENNG